MGIFDKIKAQIFGKRQQAPAAAPAPPRPNVATGTAAHLFPTLSLPAEAPTPDSPLTVCDPSCGSGR